MEIVKDINEDTVDFVPNYDGRTQEPVILPSRFPNLLINGSSGIAVGMATNIPPHNLREVASGIQWSLENPTASREELLNALLERIKGPDFPTKSQIIGYRGIEEAYRTGRGSVTMRAVIDVEEDSRGRAMLVISELPYQVNPDNLKLKIAELVDAGKVPGIADLRDDSSSRTGMRIVVVLKKDAVATVVKNNLYKHTQLQETFGCNMLALVDGVPRTLTIDQFISYWIAHQIEVIQRRTKYRLREAEKRAHILNGYLKALDAIDAVIKLIRASQTPEEARIGLMQLLGIDEIQATAILDLQLRRLAALERQKIIDEHAELMALITSYQAILANEDMQRKIIGEELKEIVDKFGDERRTAIVPDEGEVSMADLIAERDVVITITRDGYAKRTMTDLYRSQRRGGKGIKGAALREDDIVEHFLVTSSHDLLLFFTNKGRVYRAKGYEVPEAGRDAKGKHVANLLALTGDEQIAQVLSIKNYEDAKYLVLATKSGFVKKTALSEFDTSRSTLIAINLKEDDEVISARLIGKDEDLILVSAKGLSVRFNTNDATLRPMGRATSGVIGMRFKSDTDHLLAMDVVREGAALVTVTDGGFAKRTSLTEWPAKGRGTMGMRAMRLVEERGELVAALVCEPNDELFGIASNGIVIRTQVSEVRATGRDTMGVSFMDLKDGAVVVAVAKLLADETEEE
jgi:DNA gyrase subunit A